jgi:hypothetical protein
MKFNGAFKAILPGLCLAMLCNLAMAADPHEAAASDDSAFTLGLYEPEQKEMLVPVFVSSTNNWLRRYHPKLISRSETGARMQVDYDGLFDIELTIKEREYEIAVRPAQKVTREERAQRIAAKLLSGVQKNLASTLRRGDARRRDR